MQQRSSSLYVDKVAPAIPQWYAEYKYQYDKPVRELYIESALDPYAKAYRFYTMSEAVKRKRLLEAAKLEKKRHAKLRAKLASRASWRSHVQFVL